jgi:hypothetical protein
LKRRCAQTEAEYRNSGKRKYREGDDGESEVKRGKRRQVDEPEEPEWRSRDREWQRRVEDRLGRMEELLVGLGGRIDAVKRAVTELTVRIEEPGRPEESDIEEDEEENRHGEDGAEAEADDETMKE